jgi:hypothetical protein
MRSDSHGCRQHQDDQAGRSADDLPSDRSLKNANPALHGHRRAAIPPGRTLMGRAGNPAKNAVDPEGCD